MRKLLIFCFVLLGLFSFSQSATYDRIDVRQTAKVRGWLIYQGDTLGIATVSGDTLFITKGATVDTLVAGGTNFWTLRSTDTITAPYNVYLDSAFMMKAGPWYLGYQKEDTHDDNADSLVFMGYSDYDGSGKVATVEVRKDDSDTNYYIYLYNSSAKGYTYLKQSDTNIVINGPLELPNLQASARVGSVLVTDGANKNVHEAALSTFADSLAAAWAATPTPYTTWVRDITAGVLSPATITDNILVGSSHSYNFGTSLLMQGFHNIIDSVYHMAKYPYYSTAIGNGTRVYDWYGFSSGAGAVAEGKISSAFNNHSLATVNDGHAEGNITVSGRMRFEAQSHGTITDPIVGQCSYVIIPWYWGDMTSMFPNIYTDNIETRYGTGANADARGNVNGAIHDTAVYNPDGSINTENDLTWAMHTYCYVKGVPEGDMERYKILKASHATTGDTVFYDAYPEPFSDIESIYSSYFAITADGKWNGGTGSHSEGWKTSAYGYGSHAEGLRTNAWGWTSHGEGYNTYATGAYSHSQGYHSWARRQGEDAMANGYFSRVGDNQRTEYIYKDTKSATGVILTLTDIEDSTSYYVTTMVHGVQTSTSTGNEGETFAYKFEYVVSRLGSTYTTVGTPIRTLIGRNVSDSGDGITTGERMAWYGRYSTTDDYGIAFYGAGNRTFRIVARSVWTEIKF